MNDIAIIISRLGQQRASIDRAISALREIDGLKPAPVPAHHAVAKVHKKNRLSPAGRRRIAEATRKRWAEKRAAEALTTKMPSPTKKGWAHKRTARRKGSTQAAA